MRSGTCPKCHGKKIIVLNQPDALQWFESWTCAECRYTELYAKDLVMKAMEASAQRPGQGRIVDSSKQGPYR
jgi:predicted nucleic-acid-binding Zn-ribbon protein